MAKVYEFLADGFEEVEALAPVDILRRGGVEVKMVSITGNNLVESSHGVAVKADLLFEDITDFSDADLLMLPGGMPGSKNLNEHDGVRNALKEQFEKGKTCCCYLCCSIGIGICWLVEREESYDLSRYGKLLR